MLLTIKSENVQTIIEYNEIGTILVKEYFYSTCCCFNTS